MAVDNLLTHDILSCLLTFIKKSLHVDEYIWESGELLLVLKQLRQIVCDGLCVVVSDCVTHDDDDEY